MALSDCLSQSVQSILINDVLCPFFGAEEHLVSGSVMRRAVWACYRLALSLRDVEDLLAERAITFSDETTRIWAAKFGAQIASKVQRDRAQSADTRNLAENVLLIHVKKRWLWWRPMATDIGLKHSCRHPETLKAPSRFCFRSARQAQRSLSNHDQTSTLFHAKRHRHNATDHRRARYVDEIIARCSRICAALKRPETA